MKKVILSGVALMMLFGGTTLTGCSYGGVAMSGDKAIILKNDMFLLGALRKAYVCKVEAGWEPHVGVAPPLPGQEKTTALTCKQVKAP